MKSPYSSEVYKNLLTFNQLLPFILLVFVYVSFGGIWLFYKSFPFLLLLLVGIFSGLSFITIWLQNKNAKFGLLAILNLFCEGYFLTIFIRSRLQSIYFRGDYGEVLPFLFVYIILIVLFSVHLYVLASSINLRQQYRYRIFIGITLLISVLIGGYFSYRYIRSLNVNHWPVLDSECGYNIQYSPRLRVGGFGESGSIFPIASGGFGEDICTEWHLSQENNEPSYINIIEINAYNVDQTNNFNLEDWILDTWPRVGSWGDFGMLFQREVSHNLFFAKNEAEWVKFFKNNIQEIIQKKETGNLNGYNYLKISLRENKYIIFIPNGIDRVIKFECQYKKSEQLKLCDQSLKSFRFTSFQ